MSKETEVKLDLHPAVELPPLDGLVEGASVQTDQQTLRARYFDTEDLRLVRSGITVRHRPEEGSRPWQVKLPTRGGTEDALGRHELDIDGGSRRPPTEIRQLVIGAARTAELRPVASLITERTRHRLVLDDEVVAEVADDDVTVQRGRRTIARFREVEVEGPRRRHRRPLVAALLAAGAERTDNSPKLVRALGPAATLPADVAPPELGGPDPAVPVADVVRHALLSDLAGIVRHLPGTRIGVDDEELHQMRVSTRRMRSTLRTYRPVLDPAWADGLRAEMRSLAAALGTVRDLDVLIARIAADAQRLPAADGDAAGRLARLLADRRAAARAELLALLEARSFAELLDRLLDAAVDPACTAGDAPAGPALAPLVADAWEKVERAVGRDQHLHDVRLRIKRLRYASTACTPALGPPASALAKAAGRAQELLGIHQDAQVAADAYRALLADVDGEVGHVLGQLTARALRRQRRVEQRWPDEWRRLRRRSLRRFLDVAAAS